MQTQDIESKEGRTNVTCRLGNNYRADHPPSMKEFNNRNAANLAFMKESFAEAIAADAPAVAAVIHANPDFEKGGSEGFKDFLAAMREFLSKYHKRSSAFMAIHTITKSTSHSKIVLGTPTCTSRVWKYSARRTLPVLPFRSIQ